METRPPGRKSVRLRHYNYARPGWYFITICCADKRAYFGTVQSGGAVLSELGRIAREELIKSTEIRTELKLHEFVIMPNHIHMVVQLDTIAGQESASIASVNRPGPLAAKSIPSFVAGFKGAVTSAVRKLAGEAITLWQRGYHEHVIRTDEALHSIRQYIRNNPVHWELDKYHPSLGRTSETIDEVLAADAIAILLN